MDQVYLVLLGILAVILLYIILASFFTVRTAEVAVITRFGKFLRVAEPGLNAG
jgi:regulator of protease activity HflC (stomatin/prohibitin superfamily)